MGVPSSGWGSCNSAQPPQGNNGTFLLSLDGPDAAAFSVSPERAAGSTEVQVLVKNSLLVDYEEKPKMEVEVRGAPGSWEA